MKRFVFPLMLGVLLIFAQSEIPEPPAVFSGRVWSHMEPGERFYYVAGYQQGVQLTALVFPKDVRDRVLTNNFPKGFTTGDCVAELDKLYLDRENVNIPLPLAYLHIAMKLAGKTTKEELERHLIELRQASNR